MRIPLYQVDAFAPAVFAGNPAAVCPLQEFPPDDILQAIAAENNLSETAYFVKDGESWRLRWFTPVCEVDLCGHATLASGWVLFEELGFSGDVARFQTRSGELTVTRRNGLLALNLPALPALRTETDEALVRALGRVPKEVLVGRHDYLVRYESFDDVAHLKPDMTALLGIDKRAVITTAPGEDCDFVSRFFAPKVGIAEDPVTGSAHSTLVPYWADQLGKNELHAKQISKRGGELFCRLEGERVEAAGQCSLYLRGEIVV